jgi:hypothetical protein
MPRIIPAMPLSKPIMRESAASLTGSRYFWKRSVINSASAQEGFYMAFEVGQKVRVTSTALKGNTGTILEVRTLDSGTWYQVGGQNLDYPDELWNADFRESELEAVG